MRKRARWAKWLAAGFALALSGCSTPYQPEGSGGAFGRQGGYAERQVGPYAWLVTFAGNGYTSRETAEHGFLTRAAELALSAGGDFFIVTQSNLSVYPGGQAARAQGIGAYGSFYGGAGYPTYNTGWGGWSAWDRAPELADGSVHGGPQAGGVVLVYRGVRPDTLPDAYDARQLLK